MEIINEIYDHGDIPEDLNRPIFIVLSKKPVVNEYEFNQTTRLMSHIDKLIIRILGVWPN